MFKLFCSQTVSFTNLQNLLINWRIRYSLAYISVKPSPWSEGSEVWTGRRMLLEDSWLWFPRICSVLSWIGSRDAKWRDSVAPRFVLELFSLSAICTSEDLLGRRTEQGWDYLPPIADSSVLFALRVFGYKSHLVVYHVYFRYSKVKMYKFSQCQWLDQTLPIYQDKKIVLEIPE